jgi:hypothetical protein
MNYSKNRHIIDYVGKDSNEFKGPENQYPSTPLHSMEDMELDFRSTEMATLGRPRKDDFRSTEMATLGRPRKDIDHRTSQRIVRRYEELKVKLVLA